MTTHIDTSMEFLGWPVSKLRAVLRAQNVGKGSFGDVGHLSNVKLTSGAAAAMIGEAFLRGFIAKVDEEGNPDPNGGYGLTRPGKAIASATAMRRTKKASAERILDGVLAKAAELAVDGVTPIKVSKIWVFGSYIDPTRPDVGDLDIVIETRFTGIEGTASFRRRLEYIRDRYPGLLPSGFDPIFGGREETSPAGSQRHPHTDQSRMSLRPLLRHRQWRHHRTPAPRAASRVAGPIQHGSRKAGHARARADDGFFVHAASGGHACVSHGWWRGRCRSGGVTFSSQGSPVVQGGEELALAWG